MERLPPIEEQEWMLDCLRLLIHRKGADPLLRSPIRTPRRADLGPWTPTPRGAGRILRRLLDGLGLGHLEIRVLAASAPDVERCMRTVAGPVWFGGQAAHTVWFACDLPRLPRSLGEAGGALVGPAVQVWRQNHGLQVDDGDTEEKLRDLSAVYLGLGLLAAHRAEAWRREVGVRALLATGRGGLRPQSLAYLLAVQTLLRRATCLQTAALARRLPASPRRAFLDALRHLRKLPGGLTWRLGLPGELGSRPARVVPSRRARGSVFGAFERAQPHRAVPYRGIPDPE